MHTLTHLLLKHANLWASRCHQGLGWEQELAVGRGPVMGIHNMLAGREMEGVGRWEEKTLAVVVNRNMLAGQEREAVGRQGAERGEVAESYSMLVGQGMEVVGTEGGRTRVVMGSHNMLAGQEMEGVGTWEW